MTDSIDIMAKPDESASRESLLQIIGLLQGRVVWHEKSNKALAGKYAELERRVESIERAGRATA